MTAMTVKDLRDFLVGLDERCDKYSIFMYFADEDTIIDGDKEGDVECYSVLENVTFKESLYSLKEKDYCSYSGAINLYPRCRD